MATRNRPSRTNGHPKAVLLTLVALIVALFAGIGATTVLGDAKGQWTPKLGLDLEGGRQITLEPVIGEGSQKINSGQVERAVDIIRKRVDGTGVSEAEVTTLGERNIVVSLPGEPSKEILNSLSRSSALSFRAVIASTRNEPPTRTLPQPPSVPKATATPSASGSTSPSASPTVSSAPSSSSTGANGVYPQAFPAAATPTPTPSTTAGATQSPTTATANKPKNPSDPAWAQQPVSAVWVKGGVVDQGSTYQDLLQEYSCTDNETRLIASNAPADQPVVMCDQTQQNKFLLGPVEVKGDSITDATSGPETNQQGVQTGGTQINLKFNSTGKKAFGTMTTRLAALQSDADRNRSAIIVDGQVLEALGTKDPITNGEAQITGGFTPASGKLLADELKFGALPFSFTQLTNDQISPQLGQDQLQKGLLAGAVGMLLVVLYSLFQYRVLGLVTVASLVISAIFTYGLVTFLGYANNFRLTMAGVTGLIVAIGVTADSFIVYFERVRDEVRSGRPLRSAVETGWQRARRTIIISDVVNFLASAVLYILSEANVKAFAFTLGLTTLIDIVVVMMFTHPLLTLLARTKFFGSGHKWSGFDPDRLGAKGVTYAGRGRVTIADRRRAAAGGQI
ncbi:protein translocase subunit SecD [Luteipulveratus sp. YIM 133132]|uniref:protein translocase subunit SecD n=1 Tax=Luteipulveratus flavus TaxID=3031728 RepID=UPI0023AFC4AD|nr:protein translocase subunit SecD [Luteipulveratus sp. YIM 133132]MDE9367329.1 protein translocase subunit SecD [Luteipulveratus sp. YIM 133132]